MQAGVVAAFGLVRGAAQADMLQQTVDNPFQIDLLAKVCFTPFALTFSATLGPLYAMDCILICLTVGT